MNSLNSVLIEGNLTGEPDLRKTSKGTPFCQFSIASTRWHKNENSTEKEVGHFDVLAWAKLAEIVKNLGHHGRGIRIVGRLKEDSWTDDKGKQNSKTIIVAEHVEFRSDQNNGNERSEG